MATLRGQVCAESQTIQRNLSMVVDRITKSAGPLWLSQKLQEEGIISAERAADVLNTLGISSSDKVSSMMEAVESKIRNGSKPSQPFEKFIKILQTEPSLQDVVRTLEVYYKDFLDNDDSESDDRVPLLTTAERHEAIIFNQAASSHLNQTHARQSGEVKLQLENNDRTTHKVEGPVCLCCTTVVMLVTFITSTFTGISGYHMSKRSSNNIEQPLMIPFFYFVWDISPAIVLLALIIHVYRKYIGHLATWVHFYIYFMAIIYCTAMLMHFWKQERNPFLSMSSLDHTKSSLNVEFSSYVDITQVLCGFDTAQRICILTLVYFMCTKYNFSKSERILQRVCRILLFFFFWITIMSLEVYYRGLWSVLADENILHLKYFDGMFIALILLTPFFLRVYILSLKETRHVTVGKPIGILILLWIALYLAGIIIIHNGTHWKSWSNTFECGRFLHLPSGNCFTHTCTEIEMPHEE